MTTTEDLTSRQMGKKATLDLKTRQWIAAHLRRLQHERRYKSDAEMARDAGVTRSAMSRALRGDRTVGLDFLLLVRANLKVSIDMLVGKEPDAEWLDPNYEPPNKDPR